MNFRISADCRLSSAVERPLVASCSDSAKIARCTASSSRLRTASSRASNPFFTDVARGAEDAARRAGLALFLCNSEEDPAREAEYLDVLLEQRVRGVLITPVERSADRLRSMPQLGVPVVLLDRRAVLVSWLTHLRATGSRRPTQ